MRAAPSDPRLERALNELERPNAQGDDGAEVQRLVDELDQIAWKVQAEVHAGRAPEEDYLEAFSSARAASAVAFALDPDPFTAAVESVYEAQSAVRDVARVRALVLDILGR